MVDEGRVITAKLPADLIARLDWAVGKIDRSKSWIVRQALADWVAEVHDTHHPIASSLYYEDQKREAKRRSRIFLAERLPKFMRYFEREVDAKFSYVHLSMFQMIEGLRYAFPRAMRRTERKFPRLLRLHDQVARRPRLDRYLASDRRIPFNQDGIFRHYPELDAR